MSNPRPRSKPKLKPRYPRIQLMLKKRKLEKELTK